MFQKSDSEDNNKNETVGENVNEQNNESVETNENIANANDIFESGGPDTDSNDSQKPQGIGGGDDLTNYSESDDDVTYIKKHVSFVKPLENGTITSRYGARQATSVVSANHKGVDIGANYGSDIKSSMKGTVTLVSEEGDYGKHVEVTDGEVSTLYAHCSNIIVNQGDYVQGGQKIAEVGSTGKSTGPHLHFEIRRNNLSVNPEEILSL